MSSYDFIVRITNQTGGTVTITSSPFQVRRYDLRAGKRQEEETDNNFEVRLRDGSAANNLDELRTLNDLLRDAYDRNQQYDRRIDPVYLTWQESSGGTVWRSEITDASADWVAESLEYGYWVNDTQFADLELTRVNYWEGPEAQVPLTNPNGTANTSGLAVYNSNDGSGGTRYNYVDIDGDNVIGDLPGDTRLEMTNTYGTANPNLATVYIGQNWHNPSTFDHWLEFEDATSGGTANAAAGYSGGTAIIIGIPSDSETELFTFSLDSTYMTAADGGYFKALARFALGSPAKTVRYRLKLDYNASTVWQTELVTLDNNISSAIRDLVTFQLPPWLPGLDNLEALDLILSAYQITGSPFNQTFDALQITPVDGWRLLHFIGYGTPHNYRIVDDGIGKHLYQDNGSGSNKAGIYVGYGRSIQLKPDTDQRLYFQTHATTANVAEVDRSISVKLYYRPKRYTL